VAPHHGLHEAGPSHRSRTPTPPQRTSSPPLSSPSHTLSLIHRSPLATDSPVRSSHAGSVRYEIESDIPSATSHGSEDVERSSSTTRVESERSKEATETEREETEEEEVREETAEEEVHREIEFISDV